MYIQMGATNTTFEQIDIVTARGQVCLFVQVRKMQTATLYNVIQYISLPHLHDYRYSLMHINYNRFVPLVSLPRVTGAWHSYFPSRIIITAAILYSLKVGSHFHDLSS